MLLVLLSVGGVVLARASTSDDEFGSGEQLVWADVERQFERVDRRGLRPDPTGGADDPVTEGSGTPHSPTRAPGRAPDPTAREQAGDGPVDGDRPPDQP